MLLTNKQTLAKHYLLAEVNVFDILLFFQTHRILDMFFLFVPVHLYLFCCEIIAMQVKRFKSQCYICLVSTFCSISLNKNIYVLKSLQSISCLSHRCCFCWHSQFVPLVLCNLAYACILDLVWPGYGEGSWTLTSYTVFIVFFLLLEKAFQSIHRLILLIYSHSRLWELSILSVVQVRSASALTQHFLQFEVADDCDRLDYNQRRKWQQLRLR